MTDPPRHPDTSDDTGVRRSRESSSGARNRTKVLVVIIGSALLAVMIGLHLAGVTPH